MVSAFRRATGRPPFEQEEKVTVSADWSLDVEQRARNSVGLLISILVRYPELASINFDPKQQSLKFTFLATKILPETEFHRLRDLVEASLDAYWGLSRRRPAEFSFTISSFAGVSVLEMTRDVASLSQEELALVISLMKDALGDRLVVDRNDGSPDEDLSVQEELIQEMLEDIKEDKLEKNLIAFREEGRVLVFNK